MARTLCYDKKSGLKKGSWTREEDKKLAAYVNKFGCWNWRQLPKFAGLSRCGKSCRLRWLNYLQPNIKRGNYTKEEDDIIMKLHADIGNKWSAMTVHLPGRSDNEIKNHWHTSLKKRSIIQDQLILTSKKKSSNEKSDDDEEQNIISQNQSYSEVSSCATSITDQNLDGKCDIIQEKLFEDQLSGNFWTEPFLLDSNFSTTTTSTSSNELFVPSEFDYGLNLYPFSPVMCYDEFNYMLIL